MNKEQTPKEYFRNIGQTYATDRAQAQGDRTQARRTLAETIKTPLWKENRILLRKEAAERRTQRLIEELWDESLQAQDEPRVGTLHVDSTLDPESEEYVRAYDYLNITRDIKKEKKRVGWIDTAAKHLLNHPESIETSTKVWLHPIVEVDEAVGKLLYDSVKKRMTELVRQNWETTNTTSISTWITLAAHAQYPDIPNSLLDAYFHGPQTTHDEKRKKAGKTIPVHQEQQLQQEKITNNIRTYYNLAYAAISVGHDSQSLLKAVGIGQFFDPEILNPETQPEYFRDILLTSFTEIDNDKLLQMVYQPATIFNELLAYAGLERENVLAVYRKFMYSSFFQTALKNEQDRRISTESTLLGRMKRKKKMQQLLETFAESSSSLDTELLKEYEEWPRSFLKGTTDPLRKHYVSTLREHVLDFQLEEELHKESGDKGKTTLVTQNFEPGITCTIGVPIAYVSQEDRIAILREVAKQQLSQEQKAHIREGFLDHATYLPFETNTIMYKDKPVTFWYRRTVSVESRRHKLADLEEVGFPQPALEENKSLQMTNTELQKEIQRIRTRFLTPRGIRITLPDELQRIGYENLILKQDRANPHITHAQIKSLGRVYELLLTRDLSFNLEGKELPNRYLQDAIQWMVLSYLKRYLCQEYEQLVEKELEKKETDITRQPHERAGHYRSLPPGFTYSFRAAELCWAQKREILSDETIRLNQARIKKGKDPRDFTYVTEITSKEDLGPVPVYYDNALTFAASQTS